MKTLVTLTITVILLTLAALSTKAQDTIQIQYFETYTWTKNDGSQVLQADFYVYEDMSLYMGSGSIHYSCSTGTFYIDEIVDVPKVIYVEDYHEITEAQIIEGISYILNQFIAFQADGNFDNIFTEWQPDSIYNLNHPSAQINRDILSSYQQFDHTEFCGNTIYLPIVTR